MDFRIVIQCEMLKYQHFQISIFKFQIVGTKSTLPESSTGVANLEPLKGENTKHNCATEQSTSANPN